MTTDQLHLTFPAGTEPEPIVEELRGSFPLHVDIRRANVEEARAWYIVDLAGEPADIERAVGWLLERDVVVDRIPIEG